MDDSRVKKASEILSRFFDDTTLQAATQFEMFRSSWKQLVGQRLADHSKPKSVLHRTLLISADHAGWVQLLQLDQERILARISKHYPELEITSLAFTVEERGDILPAEALPFAESAAKTPTAAGGGPEAIENESQMGPGMKTPLPEPLERIFSRMQRTRAGTRHTKGN
jgi:hypothetical protein